MEGGQACLAELAKTWKWLIKLWQTKATEVVSSQDSRGGCPRGMAAGDGRGGWPRGMAAGDGCGGWPRGMAAGDSRGGWPRGIAAGDGPPKDGTSTPGAACALGEGRCGASQNGFLSTSLSGHSLRLGYQKPERQPRPRCRECVCLCRGVGAGRRHFKASDLRAAHEGAGAERGEGVDLRVETPREVAASIIVVNAPTARELHMH